MFYLGGKILIVLDQRPNLLKKIHVNILKIFVEIDLQRREDRMFLKLDMARQSE